MEARHLKLVEAYKLSNSEFGESFLVRLGNLYKFDKFTDVTLATDDGGRLPAHRLILATSFRLLVPHLWHQVPVFILSLFKNIFQGQVGDPFARCVTCFDIEAF